MCLFFKIQVRFLDEKGLFLLEIDKVGKKTSVCNCATDSYFSSVSFRELKVASPKMNKRRRTGDSGMVQQQEQQQEQEEEEEDFEALWEALTGISPEEEKVDGRILFFVRPIYKYFLGSGLIVQCACNRLNSQLS